MRAQASLEFMLIGSAVAAMALFLIGFYSRNLFSQASALASAARMPANLSYPEPLFLFNYSPATTTAYAASYAYITNASESVGYGLSPPEYVTNLTQFSHCTYHGFYGNRFGVQGQCGTSNAWDYIAGYDCASTGAYCIIPHDTGYAVDRLNGSRSYSYNFTLVIGSPAGRMRSQISSVRGSSPVMLNGNEVGSASVSSVSSTDAEPSISLLQYLANYSVANQTYLSAYSQQKSVLYPMLAFYNNTGVDSSTQEIIEQSIGAFSSAQLHLVSGSAQVPQCAVVGNSYTCAAASPFLYLINVTLSPGAGVQNQTFYYLGSVINVRS